MAPAGCYIFVYCHERPPLSVFDVLCHTAGTPRSEGCSLCEPAQHLGLAIFYSMSPLSFGSVATTKCCKNNGFVQSRSKNCFNIFLDIPTYSMYIPTYSTGILIHVTQTHTQIYIYIYMYIYIYQCTIGSPWNELEYPWDTHPVL